MPRDNSTNPWVDPANQAVGAMYKYYMSQPTAADQAKAQLQQMQLQEMQRSQSMGDFTMQNLSPEIRNDLYRRKLQTSGDTSGAQLFGTYVNKPMQVDAGDMKYIIDGSTGIPMQEYSVGIGPERQVDKENGRVITMPAIPGKNRPTTPITDMFGQFGGNTNDPVPEPLPIGSLDAGDVQPVMDDLGVTQMDWGQVLKNINGTVDPAMPTPITPDVPMGQPVQQPTQVEQGGMTVTNLPRTAEDIKLEGMKNFSKGIKTNAFNQTIQSAMYNIGKGGAGVGSIVKGIPVVGGQTKAANLEADLSKITNSAAIEEIARLKEESKTGGFFGNLSDGERQAVADSQLAIRQNMDPKELAYRLAMHQDLVNDIVYNRGKTDPVTGEVMPLDAGVPRSGLPTIDDVNNAQSIEELTSMWDSFNKIPAFEGQPPSLIEDALIKRVNALRGGQ